MADSVERWRDRLRSLLRQTRPRRYAEPQAARPPGDLHAWRETLPHFEEPVGIREFFRSVPALRARRMDAGGGTCWWLSWRAEELPVPARLRGALREAIRALGAVGSADSVHPDLRPLTERQAGELVFFDLETLGLGNAAVFLIGLLTLRGDQLLVEQFLAQDYSEEGAIIAAFRRCLDEGPLLISFNGKAFDLPLLSGRAGLWRVELPSAAALHHLDMLYECRRRWSGRLPDCRLQTLEEHVCGRRRVGDIPGERIPTVYHEFVASGDARLIGPVLKHNVLDLVTMAEVLLACLARGGDG